MGVGYSYCDLQFLAEADVGVGLSPNLPTDLMVDNLDKIVEILKVGPYLLQTLSQIFNQIIYQILSITTIITVYEIALLTQNSSMTLNSTLIFIYTVIFSSLQILFTIFANRKAKKLIRPAYYVNFRNAANKTFLTILEGIIHGAIITAVTLMVLPSVRIQGKRLLPVEAAHMAIFIQLILIGSFRHFLDSGFKKRYVPVYSAINILIVALSVVLAAIIKHSFTSTALQFAVLLSNYDSITMIINTTVFCISFSLFLMKIIKERLFPDIFDQFSR